MKLFRFIKSVVYFLLGAWLIAFALSNREHVVITLFPLPIQIETPLFVVLFVLLFISLLVGGFVAGMRTLSWKRKLKKERQRAALLEREVAVAEPKADTLAIAGQ